MSGDREQRRQQGLAALKAGDAATARALFATLTQDGEADAPTWLALAFSCVGDDDFDAALEAVDGALALDPRNMRALLFKADHLDRMGQPRAALGFYRGALQVASQLDQVPPDVEQGLHRAARFSERYASDYRDYLLQALSAEGYQPGESERFAESLDLTFGQKRVHYQQPTRYYFPGLAQRAFFPRDQFPWLAQLEAETPAIRAELEAMLAVDGSFGPYLEAGGNAPELNDRSNLGSMDWSACYLWREGSLVEDNAARCPTTVAALEQVPLCKIPGQMPSALFSRLAPGATIVPHHGAVNTRLICHLPLIVPPDCGSLRVGNHEKSWREGEAFVFDDSMEHEAWNHSDRERVVLLFDVWRPELSADERHWVSRMLQAVYAYSGA